MSFSTSVQAQKSEPDSALHERLPEFPGGTKAFYKYISRNLKYPASAIKAHIQGAVLVTIIIDHDGSTTVDSLNFEKIGFHKKVTDETLKLKAKEEVAIEINNLFGNMPKWTPGYQSGKPVRVKYTLPYHFQ